MFGDRVPLKRREAESASQAIKPLPAPILAITRQSSASLQDMSGWYDDAEHIEADTGGS